VNDPRIATVAPGLVIFDCDGVLVDSEPISRRVLAESLTRAGLPTTAEEAGRDYFGPRLSEVVVRAETKLGRRLGSAWVDDFERRRAAAFRSELVAVAGVAAAIESIVAAGIPVCVASQAAAEKTRAKLELTGLATLFPDDTIFSAELVKRGKPAPDVFLHAAEAMGVAPESSVVVEDTPRGVAAGRRAGMRVLGFVSSGEPEVLQAAGAETLASMAELTGLLGVTPA
jgi:HAD superfamily hydrolase (TIGR01509 family)